MDAEEARRLLAQVKVRYLILEADKEAESARVAKYRKILDTFAGEDSSGVTEPEATSFLHAARSVLAHPTLPVASSSSGPEVLSVARRPSADPPMVGRKSNSSSAENSLRSSERTRRFSNVSQSSTSKPCDTQIWAPRDRFKHGMDVEGIFERAGLTPLVLTRAEVSCAEDTPGIHSPTFRKLFGGSPSGFEWAQCSKVPGYEDFVCTTITAQPFMPLVPGKPGILLRLPAVFEMTQSDRDKTFHVLSTTQPSGPLHYRGKYTKIPLPQIQFTWTNVKNRRFKEGWIKRAFRKSTAIRARIELRNKIKREPSASEVQDYMQHQFTDSVTYKEVSAAFRSGEEKLALDGIECKEYDSHLATLIQGTEQVNNMGSLQ